MRPVEKSKRAAGNMSHLDHLAHAKGEQHAGLHPLHGMPPPARVALRRAHLSALERVEQLGDRPLRIGAIERAILRIRSGGALNVLAYGVES